MRQNKKTKDLVLAVLDELQVRSSSSCELDGAVQQLAEGWCNRVCLKSFLNTYM